MESKGLPPTGISVAPADAAISIPAIISVVVCVLVTVMPVHL